MISPNEVWVVVDEVIEPCLHCIPVVLDDSCLSVALIECPGKDHPCFTPARRDHRAEGAGLRGDSRKGPFSRLSRANFEHESSNECVNIHIECRGVGKDLNISRPSHALIALWTVRWNPEKVGSLAPESILPQALN